MLTRTVSAEHERLHTFLLTVQEIIRLTSTARLHTARVVPVAIIFVCVLVPRAFGQQRPNPDSHSQAAATNSSDAKPRNVDQNHDEIRKHEESQRMLGVVPMYAVTNGRQVEPLTPREKFHLFAKSAFDPKAADLSFFFSQASTTEHKERAHA